MTTVGYPKLRYRKVAAHQYELFVTTGPGTSPVEIGMVRRYGSLPSCQSWRAQGNWPGAGETRSRQSRGDAGADLWSAWNARTAKPKTLGEMTPAERHAAIGRALGRLQAELQAAGPAISKILDEAEVGSDG